MKKLFKKAMALMLCLALTCGMLSAFSGLSLGASVTPTGIAVSTVEEFLAMDANGSYYLANDIDFSGKTYTKNMYTKAFKGTLDGNGHALLGINVLSANSDAGIFANGFGGTMKNITFGTADSPVSVASTGSGYSVACVAGTMVGGATFENVTLYCDVRGDGKTAGFTSYMPSGKITITGSNVYGNITGNPASGFLTMSNDGSCDIEIVNSINYATVTAGNLSAGGFYAIHASTSGARTTNAVFKGCVNYGAITATDWRVGGIVGEFNENKASTLTVSFCYNLGAITMKGGGGYAAGIVGGMSFDPPTGMRLVEFSYNAGLVRNTENAQRAYALANADKSTSNAVVLNSVYIDGTPVSNTSYEGVVKASGAAEVLAIVSEYPAAESGICFLKDSGNINEGYPILSFQSTFHENLTAYACGRRVCNDCGAILTQDKDEQHLYVDRVIAPSGYMDGYLESQCSACGVTAIREGAASVYAVAPVDGVYAVDSADDLIWYGTNLNAGLLTGFETLVLTADIDLSGKTVVPIGTKKNPFRGSFDGAYHTVKNMTLTSDGYAALFSYVGMGATLQNLVMTDITLTSGADAGALVGFVASGAVVTVTNIALNKVSVAASGAAGSLIGSTAYASDVTVNACVAQNATVEGDTAGGFLGNGDNTTMTNCYVDATLSSANRLTGSLGYHSGRLTAKFCGYVRNAFASVTNGDVVSKKLFASGEIAYLINSYENNFVYGVADGVTTLSDTPTRLVRMGGNNVYTNGTLATDRISLYAAATDNGVSLAIVLARSANIKMTDYEIKVTSGGTTKTVTFSELTLTRYMEAESGCLTVNTVDTILYTVTLEGVSLDATYEIGALYSGSASTVG